MTRAAKPTEFIDVTLHVRQLEFLIKELQFAEDRTVSGTDRKAQMGALVVAFSAALEEAKANTTKVEQRADIVKKIIAKLGVDRPCRVSSTAS